MKKVSLFLLLVWVIFALRGQTVENVITTEKQRLLILPSNTSDDPTSIGNEVASIVSDVATRLGRFEVIDRNDLEEILKEQALQLTGIIDDAQIVEMGRVASANEALVVNVVNFYQQGVPPKDEEDEDEEDKNGGLFGQLMVTVVKEVVRSALWGREKDESDPYPHNIQTTLSVHVKKIRIETGKSLDSFTITTGHTGGNRGRSRAISMMNFRRQLLTKMKHFYTLTSEVLSVKRREALLFLGSELGIRRGTLFEIVRPDRVRTIRGREIIIPGKRVGIVQVKTSSADANRSIILRNWRPIREGYRALEYTKTPMALELGYTHNSETPYTGFRVGLMGKPFHQAYFGARLQLANTSDSFDRKDLTVGFSGFGGWRFLRTSWFSFTGNVNLGIDLAFRPDDKHHNVAAALFSASPLLEFELLLSETKDLVAGVGYRFGGHSSHWTYSVAENDDKPEQRDAQWDGVAPNVDLSGLFFTVGLKFISF